MTEENQHCNAAGLALLKKYERCLLMAYYDPGGVLTIGWGHTGADVVPGLVWGRDRADAQLAIDIVKIAEEPVHRLVNYELTDNQFSALVCFVYNIGQGNFERSSTLCYLNGGDFDAVGPSMALWNKDHAGKVLNGLCVRRSEEAELFYTIDPEEEDPEISA